MRFALGMDNREIARAMGRSDGATKVLIHRAIKQLEEIVDVAMRMPTSCRKGRRGMSEAVSGLEGLLHKALSPVEPPEDLGRRLESTLTSLTESAVEELEAWELSAMRDPRNWVRPAAAVVVGGSAGVALVLLRARHRARPGRTTRWVLAAPPSVRLAICASTPAACWAIADFPRTPTSPVSAGRWGAVHSGSPPPVAPARAKGRTASC